MLQLMEMWNVTIMSYSDNHEWCACVCVYLFSSIYYENISNV